MLTQKRLRKLFRYDPFTGHFYHKATRGGQPAGSTAGSLNKKGHIVIGVDRKIYNAHRLAWLYVTGALPRYEIDHRNLIKSDNRWDNLRPADDFQQGYNKPRYKNNTSGFKGVYLHRQTGKWRPQVKVRGKYVTKLGLFSTAEEAFKVRCAVVKRLHGEFARID